MVVASLCVAMAGSANAAMIGLDLSASPIALVGQGWNGNSDMMAEVDIASGTFRYFDGSTYRDQDGTDLGATHPGMVGGDDNFAIVQGASWYSNMSDWPQFSLFVESPGGLTSVSDWSSGYVLPSVYDATLHPERWLDPPLGGPSGQTFSAADDWSSQVGITYAYDGGQWGAGATIVGLRFNMADGVHYGFVYTSGDGWNNASLRGFGYNDVAGEAAVADFSVCAAYPPIPEPATMSLLAVGIVGLIRRKK